MLLNIYLGTTVISWIVNFIFSVACAKRIKRKGYKFIKEKKSFMEKLANFISLIFKGSIPVYNIINSIVIICMGDKLYDHMEYRLLEEGKIYMPKDDYVIIEPEMEYESVEKEQNKVVNIQGNFEKAYEDMSIEEKLASLTKEKEKLKEQNLGQQGPTLRRTFKPRKK